MGILRKFPEHQQERRALARQVKALFPQDQSLKVLTERVLRELKET
jgi:hypothetical protein